MEVDRVEEGQEGERKRRKELAAEIIATWR
jgi:hypothetical protein